jgi:hypothetical protein
MYLRSSCHRCCTSSHVSHQRSSPPLQRPSRTPPARVITATIVIMINGSNVPSTAVHSPLRRLPPAFDRGKYTPAAVALSQTASRCKSNSNDNSNTGAINYPLDSAACSQQRSNCQCASLHFRKQCSVIFSPDAFTLCVAAAVHRHAVAYAALLSPLLSSAARASFNSCIVRWASRHTLFSTRATPIFTSLALSFSTMAFIFSGIICGRQLVLLDNWEQAA